MLTDLMQVQIGTESTWGTPVTPTAKLARVRKKPDVIQANVAAEVAEDQMASLGPSGEAVLLAHSGAFALDQAGLYEDINYWLESIVGAVTPSGVGPYTRAGVAPLAAVPTSPKKYTVYHGDATEGLRLQGGIVNSLTIKGESKGRVETSVAGLGESVDAGTPAALSDRTVTPILGAHGAVYVDAWGATIGTTAIASSAYAFELAIGAPRELKTYLGSVIPTDWNENKLTGVLKLTLEWNATTSAYFTGILSTSAIWQRQVRLKFDNTANYQLQMDFAGTALEAPRWASRNGVTTFDVTLTATYNSTLANWFKYQTKNQLSTLP